jgi:hypothetical protein
VTFSHSKNSRILVNATSQSGYVTAWTAQHSRAVASVSVLSSTGERYIPGLQSGSVSITGLFDSTAGSLHAETITDIGTDDGYLVSIAPDGFALGAPVFIAISDIANYTVTSTLTDAVHVNVDAVPGDGVDWGNALHDLSAETADVNGTGLDNSASSANGGVAALHVTAYSGLTNAVIKVQHSTNNSVWSDLITFTTVTGTTWERKTVTGTVNQYTRSFLDVTGSGSVTFALSFARR